MHGYTVSVACVGNTVRIDSHAAATLRYIRSSMDGAALFAVPGSAGIVLGSIALAATGLCLAPGLHKYWLGIWLCAALLKRGVRMGAMGRHTVRAVTHLDVSRADIDSALAQIRVAMEKR